MRVSSQGRFELCDDALLATCDPCSSSSQVYLYMIKRLLGGCVAVAALRSVSYAIVNYARTELLNIL